MELKDFVGKLDALLEEKAFPIIDLLCKNSYLTEPEAEELKIRRPVRKELNGILCAHYTSVEGRTIYFRSVSGTIRFVFLREDGKADFCLDVTNDTNVIEFKQYN